MSPFDPPFEGQRVVGEIPLPEMPLPPELPPEWDETPTPPAAPANSEYREGMKAARDAGLAKRQAARLARTRTVEGQFDDKAMVEPGRGTVYLKVVGDHYESTIALSPDSARELADLLKTIALEATP